MFQDCYWVAGGLKEMICRAGDVLNVLVPVLIALAVVVFIWGIIRYVIADSEEAKKKGRDTMIFGIIGFAVVIALWGLVYVLVDTFNLGYDVAPYRPQDSLLPQ